MKAIVWSKPSCPYCVMAKKLLEQKGYEIDRRRITILEDVKEAGTYNAQIDFGKENILELSFEVIGE